MSETVKLVALKSDTYTGVISINPLNIDAIVPRTANTVTVYMESGARFHLSLSLDNALAQIERQLAPSDNTS